MEGGYDKINQRCNICKARISFATNYKRHYQQVHSPDNSFKCDFEGCTYALQTLKSLNKHRTECHNEPGYNAVLPDDQRMIWGEEIKCVHDKSVVGVFLGVCNSYHAPTAARKRDNKNSFCIVS